MRSNSTCINNKHELIESIAQHAAKLGSNINHSLREIHVKTKGKIAGEPIKEDEKELFLNTLEGMLELLMLHNNARQLANAFEADTNGLRANIQQLGKMYLQETEYKELLAMLAD